MTIDEQIAALRARLDDVNNSISQLDSALAASKDSDERAELAARISQLQQTAETLRTMLNNLATSRAPMAMAVPPALAQRTVQAHTKAMVKSAKTFADQSHKRAMETLNLIRKPGRVRLASRKPDARPRKVRGLVEPNSRKTGTISPKPPK
jgi:predicted  nucleic acid-binding Zn-ribbon protein